MLCQNSRLFAKVLLSNILRGQVYASLSFQGESTLADFIFLLKTKGGGLRVEEPLSCSCPSPSCQPYFRQGELDENLRFCFSLSLSDPGKPGV